MLYIHKIFQIYLLAIQSNSISTVCDGHKFDAFMRRNVGQRKIGFYGAFDSIVD